MGTTDQGTAAPVSMISVLIPERGRPDNLNVTIRSLHQNALRQDDFEILVGIDADDPAWAGRDLPKGPNIRAFRDPRPPTLGEKLNILATRARGDILWFFGNDMTMETMDWPAKFREVCAALPNGIGVPFVRDPLNPDHPTYWLMTRVMRDAIGFYAAPWFPYWFIDTWMDALGTMTGLRFPIDVDVAPQGGRGLTHGMVDLPFWVEFFQGTHPLRLRDATELIVRAFGPDSEEGKARLAALPSRAELARQRVAHLSDPRFLATWGDKAESPPAPQYPDVKAFAERMLEDLKNKAPRQTTVAIAVPSGREWCGTTGNCVAAMAALTAMQGVAIFMLNVQSSDPAHGRNSTVEIALQQGCDYIMWIDSDMKMPPDTLLKLLRHQTDIVGATYSKRVKDPSGQYPILGRLKGIAPVAPGSPLFEASLMPGGVMLVRPRSTAGSAGPTTS